MTFTMAFSPERINMFARKIRLYVETRYGQKDDFKKINDFGFLTFNNESY